MNQKEVRQILCILSDYQAFIHTNLRLTFGFLGERHDTLLLLYDYSELETAFVYRTLGFFFNERMNGYPT